MTNLLYNKKIKLLLRIFSALAMAILFTSIFFNLYDFFNNGKIYSITSVVINSLVVVLFVFVMIYPEKFGLIALACLLYSVMIHLFEEENPMGAMMFVLAMVIFYVRGFFDRHRKIRILFCVCFFLALQCSRLRFGIKIFLDIIFSDIGYMFILFFIILLLMLFVLRNKDNEKILNVAKFSGLKESDAEMLRRVLDNQQYKVIAIDLNQKEGSIRNRLNRVYDILGVGDRIGFITSYKGFEVSYVPEPEDAVNEVSDAVESSETERADL